MTAAQTQEHEDKQTGTRKKKIRKVGSKAQEHENNTQGVQRFMGEKTGIYMLFAMLPSKLLR